MKYVDEALRLDAEWDYGAAVGLSEDDLALIEAKARELNAVTGISVPDAMNMLIGLAQAPPLAMFEPITFADHAGILTSHLRRLARLAVLGPLERLARWWAP